jgi:hypothetical protein
MKLTGRCHCGDVRYELSGSPKYQALCHCSDCRRSAGAPMVAWAAYAEEDMSVTSGNPTTFNSSGSAMRSFCPVCGSGLFYRNEAFLPGIVDIQIATLDNPNAFPPQLHIQVAERLTWMEKVHELPEIQRFPE